MRTNPKLIELWTKAANQYHSSLAGSPAEEYLASRGILDGAEQFLLGYVAEPAPGHEDRLRNHLSIPYITEAGVVGFKFRRIDGGDPKYMIPTGQKHHLYNVNAILNAVSQVLVVEGEIDAISATLAGYPAVAVGSPAPEPRVGPPPLDLLRRFVRPLPPWLPGDPRPRAPRPLGRALGRRRDEVHGRRWPPVRRTIW